MRKVYVLILTIIMVASLTACGEQGNNDEKEVVVGETQSNEDIIVESKDYIETESDELDDTTADSLEDSVALMVDEEISKLWGNFETLSTDINSYEKYKNNIELIEGFYKESLQVTKLLGIKMRESSLLLAEQIVSEDTSMEDKYDDLEVIYEWIYEDAGDEIYDEIYDGVLDEMYDVFYDGILDDAYDSLEYGEWSDARSNEYDWWSDTRSDVYDEWSDFRSDVYDFWSDMSSEIWDEDIERAKDVMADFKEDIVKLKRDIESNDLIETQEIVEEKTTETPSKELVDGMRPDFKEAMDSYEAFYDEYCMFVRKFNENASDLTLLSEYGDMLSKAEDMNKAFEAWNEDEMNDAELKYYLEVSNRVMQKMLEVM